MQINRGKQQNGKDENTAMVAISLSKDKKVRDTKGTFHAEIGTIKDRNGMDLTETVDTKQSWKEYKEEQYKKDLHGSDNHDGVVTHLESDILQCEVKWALGIITMSKGSRGDRIPVELFQILKDDAVKVLPKPLTVWITTDSGKFLKR